MTTLTAATAKAAPVNAPAPGPRTAPSTLLLPADMPDASALAAAATAQAGAYATMLYDAATKNDEAMPRLLKRGIQDDAISYAQYAQNALKLDRQPNNDGFGEIIGTGIIDVLTALRAGGKHQTREGLTELQIVSTTAKNVAEQLNRTR